MKALLRPLTGSLLLLIASAGAAAAHVDETTHVEPFDVTLLLPVAGVLLVAAAVTLALLPRRPRR
ncbi:MAG TPA: hypothetical protein VFK38_11050 [Candidatus Limnocylindrales bacterium]|nr:hypothetical protein [Candidatus Limnocylindrales bacterium]